MVFPDGPLACSKKRLLRSFQKQDVQWTKKQISYQQAAHFCLLLFCLYCLFFFFSFWFFFLSFQLRVHNLSLLKTLTQPSISGNASAPAPGPVGSAAEGAEGSERGKWGSNLPGYRAVFEATLDLPTRSLEKIKTYSPKGALIRPKA